MQQNLAASSVQSKLVQEQTNLEDISGSNMKYFARKKEDWLKPENIIYEITPRYARKLYKAATKPGHDNLEGTMNFNAGTKVSCIFWTVWGEIVTNKECFRRRLKGELATEKLKKKLLDHD